MATSKCMPTALPRNLTIWNRVFGKARGGPTCDLSTRLTRRFRATQTLKYVEDGYFCGYIFLTFPGSFHANDDSGSVGLTLMSE